MKKFLIMLMVVTMASFLFVGCNPVTPPVPEPEVNQAPEITSAAITSATVGVAYTYNVNATDPDTEDVLTYSLTSKPAGMSIVAATGVICWTPIAAGSFAVGIKVSDPGLLSDTQSFNITVSAVGPEPEPGPEPGLKLVGITVLPKTMNLYGIGDTGNIDSVTATYEFKGYEVDIALEKCLFLTSDIKVAKVDEKGIVTAVAVGTANIIVSYKDGEITKIDTLTVTVSAVELDYIVVSPKTMSLTEDKRTDEIDSVIAYYTDGAIDGIDPADCIFTSGDKTVATVSKAGVVEAVGKGVTTITVSYKEEIITKKDTIVVTVVLVTDTTPPVIGVHSTLGLSAYSTISDAMVVGCDGYVATHASVDEDLSSLTVWAYAGDPADPDVEKVSLWRESEGVPGTISASGGDIDCAQGYRLSIENIGTVYGFYHNAELDIFFIALKGADNPRVVITAIDLAGNVATKTIALRRATP